MNGRMTRMTMSRRHHVDVVPTENGKWKVLVDFIQRGIDYSSEKMAQMEKAKLEKEMRITQ